MRGKGRQSVPSRVGPLGAILMMFPTLLMRTDSTILLLTFADYAKNGVWVFDLPANTPRVTLRQVRQMLDESA